MAEARDAAPTTIWNPEAGATPAPTDPAVIRIAERSAAWIWRAFPYLDWRFAARGRAFGRSDGGFLTTLEALPAGMRDAQVLWLARLLAKRGVPSLLLELHLEVLARLGRRSGWSGAPAMLEAAARLRRERRRVLSDDRLSACDALFRARTSSPRRHRLGVLIAAEVADQRLGYVATDATLDWLLTHGEGEGWRAACVDARALAEAPP
ncbi:MAG: hypothetical protein U0270_45210 [Labilithrix sp.]